MRYLIYWPYHGDGTCVSVLIVCIIRKLRVFSIHDSATRSFSFVLTRASMDDRTIAEISAASRLIGDSESSDSTEEVELRKDIQDAAKKSAPCQESFIMTINMHGNSQATGRGTAADQRLLVNIITRNFFSSLIFCQEIPGKFETEVVDKCGTGGFNFVNTESEAAVMWLEKDFHDFAVDAKEKFRIAEKLREERSDVDATDVPGRLAMVVLQKRTDDASYPPFLAVSWHGPHKKAPKAKSKVLKGLHYFLRAVCKHVRVSSYIVGGDFNLDILEEDLEEAVVVPNYELTARAQDQTKSFKFIPYKDNFLVWNNPSFDGDIWVHSVRPFKFTYSEDPSGDIIKKDHDKVEQQMQTRNERADLLDHDPIIGILRFSKETGKLSNDLRTS